MKIINNGLLGRVVLLFVLAIIVLCFMSCATASQAASPGVRVIPDDYAGIVHAGSSRTPEEFELMDYMGTRWILHTFSWSRIEREPGLWNFQLFDEIVDMAAQADIKTIGLLGYGHSSIKTKNNSHFYVPPDKMHLFLEYVRKTAGHFRGRIGAWCIWNEPNTYRFWKGTDKEFYELTRLTAEAIREVDSEVIILGGAFNRGVLGLQKKFIKGLFESGAMGNVDAVAFHPYEISPARSALLYDDFRKLVEPYGFGDKIWVTEMGYPTGGWYPTKVQEKKKCTYVIKTYTLLAIRDSRVLLWYQLFDPVDRRADNSEDYFGLVRSREDHTSKGAEAFRLCATFLSGASWNEQELQRENLPRSLASYYFQGSNADTLVLWNNAPGTVKVRATLPGTGHVVHDPASGEATVIPADVTISVGSDPVFITWQDEEGSVARPKLFRK